MELIVAEIRPWIKSVNLYIKFKEEPVKIHKITNDDSTIIINDFKIQIPNVTILKDSFKMVYSEKLVLVVRFSLDCALSDFGSFKAEILKIENNLEKLNVNELRLNSNTTCEINCIKCGETLCQNYFKRVLPLPSSSPNDFFCHAHDYKLSLDPPSTELFYTSTFFQINKDLGFDKILINKYIKCKTCLSWLGIKINNTTNQFWFNSVSLKCNDDLIKSDGLSDYFSILRDVLKDSHVNTAKFIFNVQITELQNDYLFVWVLEKKLNLYKYPETSKHLSKALFKFVSGSIPADHEWNGDTSVHQLSISRNMLFDALKYMREQSNLIPEPFRVSDDFCVTYLEIYD